MFFLFCMCVHVRVHSHAHLGAVLICDHQCLFIVSAQLLELQGSFPSWAKLFPSTMCQISKDCECEFLEMSIPGKSLSLGSKENRWLTRIVGSLALARFVRF